MHTLRRAAMANDGSGQILVWLVETGLEVVKVLAWIHRLVVCGLDEPIEACGQGSSCEWADPVDPVLVGECSIGDAGAEATGGIQGATGVVYAYSCQSFLHSFDHGLGSTHLPARQ